MSDTMKRIIVGCILAVVIFAIAGLQYAGLPAVRWAGVLVILGMIAEMAICMRRAGADVLLRDKNPVIFGGFILWLVMMVFAIYRVGGRPWIVLLLLMIISGADIGAWLFGKIFGGDKMWERLSAQKTWAGQIAGVLCGTFMSVMYGLLGTDTFLPQLMWIGISVSLLSQYGDLTASWIKRKLGVKDFGNILPGHGGLLDRFDGWIYALPLVWFVMM